MNRGVVTLLALTACTLAPAPADGPGGAAVTSLPPPGFGTLSQAEISLRLSSSDLEILVTPLEESITRVAAPDTYERLSGMANRYRTRSPAGSVLFLVSFFTEELDVRFVPEEIQLISQGLRFRSVGTFPITPGWSQRRVRQRETEMAVYAFAPEVDLESDLMLAYGLEQSREWSSTLARIQAERARARARAGIGADGQAGGGADDGLEVEAAER